MSTTVWHPERSEGSSFAAVDRVRAAVAAAFDGRQESVVLAVSGGVDSMVLLDAAAASVDDRSRLIVATFDHGTGRFARDAVALVEDRCRELGVECVAGRASDRLSSEAEFRAARWAFLRDVAGARSAPVATGHTEDDQVETVLMRLMRDAGARGLAGLYAPSGVLRPLLGLRRATIVDYARARRLRWSEDPTNASPAYFRNRVRNDLLPALRSVDPAIDATLLGTARAAAEHRAEVERVCAEIGGVQLLASGGIRAPIEALGDAAAARLLWPALAARAGAVLDRRGIERLASFTAGGRVGGRVQLSGGWQVTRGRHAMVLARRAIDDEGATTQPFALSDGTRFGDWSFRHAPSVAAGDAWSAWLPTGVPLSVRRWLPGDALPGKTGGSPRRVKHLLTNAGVTGHERVGWPVVLAGDDIVWIPGIRRTDAATARSGRPGLAFVCEYHNR